MQRVRTVRCLGLVFDPNAPRVMARVGMPLGGRWGGGDVSLSLICSSMTAAAQLPRPITRPSTCTPKAPGAPSDSCHGTEGWAFGAMIGGQKPEVAWTMECVSDTQTCS